MHSPSRFEHRAYRAVIGRIFKRAVCGSLLVIAAAAWAEPQGPPPLIDRELFFGDPEIAGAQISPDGKFIAFVKPSTARATSGSSAPRSPSRPPGSSPPKPSGPSPATSGAATASTSSSCRIRAATRISTSTPSIRRPRPAAGAAGARGAQPDRGERRPRHDLRGAQDRSGHHLRRPQRSRQGVARSLQGEASRPASGRCCARTPSGSRAGSSIGRASSAWPRAPPRTATRRCCASTPTGSRRSTPATSSKPAARRASTRTASTSTWRPTRATWT